MEGRHEIVIQAEASLRLDRFLSEKFSDYSRTYLKNLIDEGNVLVNGKKTKASYKLQQGDNLLVEIPKEEAPDIPAQNISLDIIYEDDYILVINKPQGMVVHPATGNYEDTLVNALKYYTKNLSQVNGELRPGIVHRLDKDTSGLLVVAKTDEAHYDIVEQLKAHSISRMYLALVEGVIEDDRATIEAPIGRHEKDRKKMAVTEKNSKHAITNFKVLKRFKNYTFVECELITGRTHQIRVHMSYIGHPIVGDNTYGYKKQKLYQKGQLLHAYKLGLKHPISGEYMEFTAELPEYFKRVLEELDN